MQVTTSTYRGTTIEEIKAAIAATDMPQALKDATDSMIDARVAAVDQEHRVVDINASISISDYHYSVVVSVAVFPKEPA